MWKWWSAGNTFRMHCMSRTKIREWLHYSFSLPLFPLLSGRWERGREVYHAEALDGGTDARQWNSTSPQVSPNGHLSWSFNSVWIQMTYVYSTLSVYRSVKDTGISVCESVRERERLWVSCGVVSQEPKDRILQPAPRGPAGSQCVLGGAAAQQVPRCCSQVHKSLLFCTPHSSTQLILLPGKGH